MLTTADRQLVLQGIITVAKSVPCIHILEHPGVSLLLCVRSVPIEPPSMEKGAFAKFHCNIGTRQDGSQSIGQTHQMCSNVFEANSFSPLSHWALLYWLGHTDERDICYKLLLGFYCMHVCFVCACVHVCLCGCVCTCVHRRIVYRCHSFLLPYGS